MSGPLWYESRSISGVHYIGWHMHKNDFQQGSGGFASGFRYLIRNLWIRVKSIDGIRTCTSTKGQYSVLGNNNCNDEDEDDEDDEDEKIKMEVKEIVSHQILKTKDVASFVLDRIIMASDITIMQDGQILRDIFEIYTSGDNGNAMWRYETGANYNFLSPNRKENVASVFFAWGNSYTRTASVLNEEFFAIREKAREEENKYPLRNVLLHPVVEWKGRQVHFKEAILNDFGTENRLKKWKDLLEKELLPEMIRAAEEEAAGKDFHPKLSGRWINKVKMRQKPSYSNVVDFESVTPEEQEYLSSMNWINTVKVP